MQTLVLTNRLIAAAFVAGFILQVVKISADDSTSSPSQPGHQLISQLKPLNSLIGSWRGVGQPKRGSRKGAWTEKTSFAWDFTAKTPAISVKSEGGRQFEQLTIKWDANGEQLLLHQKMDGGIREYVGAMPAAWPKKIVLQSAADANGHTFRCTIQQLKDIRATILFEQRSSQTGSFRRIAEVGYTRSGAKLATAGGNQRKCIVTGGLGTIPVKFDGMTYYVCCSGCVQAFNADPEAIIAEYRQSLKQSSKK